MGDKILLTGGLGRSGRWIIQGLIHNDAHVISLDKKRPNRHTSSAYSSVDFREVDLTNGDEVFSMIHELQPNVVVHWGAYPHPKHSSGTRVFKNNVESTYNVLTAAGQIDSDVILASSEATYGYAFAENPSVPDEFPIPTEEPQTPTDAYGLSKLTAEEIGKTVVRKYEIDVTALRPVWIQYPGEYECIGFQENPKWGKSHFWGYTDVRDVVSAIIAAIEDSIDGFEAFHVSAEDNYIGIPTEKLINQYYETGTTEISVEGQSSAFSLEKTKRLLDWEPKHTWKEAANEDIDSPFNEI